ncbi:MAG: M23 family metallopeptidase [PS1 clade bacterium]|nr:M23 family metallopeptidase [PS1 clade bacterium]MBL6783766.1 M23 family metallopeptidase [PS1 clade bacterium]
MDRRETQAPEELPPHEEAALLAQQARRRRARFRFTLAVFAGLATIGWLAGQLLLPDMPTPVLSAKPAPSEPALAARWVSLMPMQRTHESDSLAAGDSLAALLARAGIDDVEADAALDALRAVFDPRKLKVGQKVRIFSEWPNNIPAEKRTEDNTKRFAGFDFIPEPRQRLVVRRTGHLDFDAVKQERPLSERFFFTDTLISSSVYEAARGGGMSPNLVVELIRLFSFSIDFQRDMREGDQLEVLFTRRFDENNQLAEEGDIVFAALTNRGKRYAYWRLANDDGTHGYFDDAGRSVQRLLMKTPVDGARLSSRFGMRRHPILGYTRLHRGLDFAAPRGTPIYAAGDGQIVALGRNGDFGKYIRIRHRNGYETAYAHMNGYARRLKKGMRVKQGQVIGYVGSTGLATGPHLHYEVLRHKKPVNPRDLEVPAQTSLTDAGLDKLRVAQTAIGTRINALATDDNRLHSLPRRSATAARR